MDDIPESNQVQQFVLKLTEFAKSLKEVTNSNTELVKTLDTETTELKKSALNLIKLVSQSISNLKQSVKATEDAGISSDPLNEQISKLETILDGLNKEVGSINVNNETGKNIRSNLEDIKSSLEQQEQILKDSTMPEDSPSGNVLGRLMGAPPSDIQETRFNGGKRRRTYKNKKYKHLTMKKRRIRHKKH